MKKSLIALVAPLLLVSLVACDTGSSTTPVTSDTSSASTDVASSDTSSSSEDSSSEDVDDGTITIAAALAGSSTATVAVKGTIAYVSTTSYLLVDATGGMLIYMGNSFSSPAYAIGDYVKVSGTLSAYQGINQFVNAAVIEKLEGTGPALPTTATAWNGAAVTAYSAAPTTGMGSLITVSGSLTLNAGGSRTYYNLDVDGTDITVSLAYMPADIASQFQDGLNYTVTGYVAGKGGGSIVNIFVTERTEDAFAAVTSMAIDGDESGELIVGAEKQMTVTVAPFNANKSVTWSSSAPTVATVDAAGKVTAVAAGTATITATTVGKTASDESITDTYALTVVENTLNISNETFTWTGSTESPAGTLNTNTGDDNNKSILTLDTDNFDLVQNQATNTGNAVTNTYPQMRLYSGHELVISGKRGQLITGIRFDTTCNSGSSIANSSHSRLSVKSAVKSGSTALTAQEIEAIVITGDDDDYINVDALSLSGLESIVFTFSGQIRTVAIAISYIAE